MGSGANKAWQPAYIGVGSNLNDPEKQVQQAVDALAAVRDSRLVTSSALYRNPPMGPQDQPDYVNAVAALLTLLEPADLLGELQSLEQTLGRTRSKGDRWGPRIIDLDLLIYGTACLEQPGLSLPHPGISERNFVLFPLRDIAATLHVPGAGVVSALASRFSESDLQRI